MARALVEKASKLQRPDNSPVRARAYYGDMDGKQRKKDFSDINTAWGELDCVAYTSTVEASISFEKTDHFDAVIGITNIVTPVNVEAFVQICSEFMTVKGAYYLSIIKKIPVTFSAHQVTKTFALNLKVLGLMIYLQQ